MTRWRRARLVLVAIMVALGGLAVTPRTAAAAEVTTQLDVPYGSTGQKLDLYQPAGPVTGRPIIILIHGGGWRSQDKSTLGWLGRLYAGFGAIALSVEFRQAPQHKFPAAFSDVREAVLYAKANALRLGGDPDKIVLMGYSSGANLAALVGLHGSVKVRGVVATVCVFDLEDISNPVMRSDIADYMGPTPWGYGSPINLVSPGDPAVLVQYGLEDELATPDQARRMIAKLRAANVPVTELSYQAGHTLLPHLTTATVDMLSWVFTLTR